MFRVNLFLVKGSRNLLVHSNCRRYSKPAPNLKSFKERIAEKFYIIDVNSEPAKCPQPIKAKIEVQDAVRKNESKEVRDDQWKRLMVIVKEIFQKYKVQASDKLREFKVQDTIKSYKKEFEVENLKKKLENPRFKEVVSKESLKQVTTNVANVSIEQWQMVKKSEGFAKIIQLPSTMLKVSKDLTLKVQEYKVIFDNSPYKVHLMKIVAYVKENGKYGATELVRFVKDVYNAPVKKTR